MSVLSRYALVMGHRFRIQRQCRYAYFAACWIWSTTYMGTYLLLFVKTLNFLCLHDQTCPCMEIINQGRRNYITCSLARMLFSLNGSQKICLSFLVKQEEQFWSMVVFWYYLRCGCYITRNAMTCTQWPYGIFATKVLPSWNLPGWRNLVFFCKHRMIRGKILPGSVSVFLLNSLPISPNKHWTIKWKYTPRSSTNP